MTLLIATIPLMIAVIAAVVAPLVATMRYEQRLQFAALESSPRARTPREAEVARVAA